MNLFEKMAVDSRDVARSRRLYIVHILRGNVVEPVSVWGINASDAICQVLVNRDVEVSELRITAKLVG